MGNLVALGWEHSRWWQAPSVFLALTLLQRFNRRNTLGVLLSILFHSFFRLPLQRFVHWLTGRPHTFDLRAQTVIDAFRVASTLPLARISQLLELQAALGCAVFRPSTSPVEAKNTTLLTRSTWFGSADVNIHVLVYFHGGGYCIGNNRQWPRFYQQVIDGALAAGVSLRVMAVEYPLATEAATDANGNPTSFGSNGFQSAVATAIAAFDYLTEEVNIPSSHIIFGGESAGGGLALATCMALRDRARRGGGNTHAHTHAHGSHLHSHHRAAVALSPSPAASLTTSMPSALILLSPWTNLTASSLALDVPAEKNEDILLLDIFLRFRRCTLANSENFARARKEQGLPQLFDEPEYRSTATSFSSSNSTESGNSSAQQLVLPSHPLISPVLADLSSLPPVHLSWGAIELIAGDCAQLRTNLQAAGVSVAAHCQPGMAHQFPLMPEAFGATSDVAVREMITFIVGRFAQQAAQLSTVSKEAAIRRNLFSMAHFGAPQEDDEE